MIPVENINRPVNDTPEQIQLHNAPGITSCHRPSALFAGIRDLAKQQKTGNHVIIPVRPELQAILDKYENRLPKSYEQKVNKFIKEIAREAGITEKIEVSYVENGERKTHLVEKCDLVKTHTARRSGATNMYLAGIPTIAIMKITGHKTEKEFMKYIKITEEQTAMELMNHPYFSGR